MGPLIFIYFTKVELKEIGIFQKKKDYALKEEKYKM